MTKNVDDGLAPMTAKSPEQVLAAICEEPWIPEDVLRATYANVRAADKSANKPE